MSVVSRVARFFGLLGPDGLRIGSSTSDPDSSELKVTLAAQTATGSAVASKAILVGGTDGTDLRAILLDSSGNVQAALPAVVASTGSATPTKAILTGGSDGTDLRAFKTDTSGVQSVALSGNSVPQATSDFGKVFDAVSIAALSHSDKAITVPLGYPYLDIGISTASSQDVIQVDLLVQAGVAQGIVVAWGSTTNTAGKTIQSIEGSAAQVVRVALPQPRSSQLVSIRCWNQNSSASATMTLTVIALGGV